MQTIDAAQQNAQVPINENFETLAAVSVFGKRHPVTTDLTWGYEGGYWSGLTISAGTVTLSNAATNYIVADRSTGAVSVATTTTDWNNPAQYARLHEITTAGSVVTGWKDRRADLYGALGYMPPPACVTIASASTIAIPLGQRVAKISGTTTITSITATGHSGNAVTLIFESTSGLTDGSNLKLASSFSATADDTITLVCDGTNWHEAGRSAN